MKKCSPDPSEKNNFMHILITVLFIFFQFHGIVRAETHHRMVHAEERGYGDLRQHRKDRAEPHPGIVRAEERAHRERRQDCPHPDFTRAELRSAREEYFLQKMLRKKSKGINYFQKLTVFVKILIFLK